MTRDDGEIEALGDGVAEEFGEVLPLLISSEVDGIAECDNDGLGDEDVLGEEDGDSMWTDVASEEEENEGLCDDVEEGYGDAPLVAREEKDGLGEKGNE